MCCSIGEMRPEDRAYLDSLTALADIKALVPDSYLEVVDETVEKIVKLAAKNDVYVELQPEFQSILSALRGETGTEHAPVAQWTE